MTARSPVRTTRPIRYSLLWYSFAVSTKLTPMVERASDLRTGGSQRLRGIAWLNPKSKSPSEKFAVELVSKVVPKPLTQVGPIIRTAVRLK